MPSRFVFVSFDIVGHGAEPDHVRQVARIETLNRIVDDFLTPGSIWASGGDGGHVAYQESVDESIIASLVGELRSWSGRERIQLRLSCHVGDADVIVGAGSDHPRQLVGDGINHAGSLLVYSTPSSCIASVAFRRFAEERNWQLLRFEDSRTIYLKHLAVDRISLVHTPRHRSAWGALTRSDRALLVEACERSSRADSNPWMIVRLAKRLLEVNGSDETARSALRSVAKGKYGELRTPPFDRIRPEDFLRLVDDAELVERDDGETFCEEGDEGDSLFVVLRGEVGVIMPDRFRPEYASVAKPRDIRLGPGEVVGELAHVLGVRRTATLQAVGPTSVLSLKRAKTAQLEIKGLNMYETFEPRVLEYLCNRAPYLKGMDDKGPLAHVDQPWKDLIHCTRPIALQLEPNQVLSTSHEKLSETGLFVLVRGNLAQVRADDQLRPVKSREPRDRTLRGSELRIVFGTIPGHIAHDFAEFRTVEGHEVELVRIDPRVFVTSFRREFDSLIAALRKELDSLVLCDVFLSYSGDDRHEAEQWAKALAVKGFSVYMNEPRGGAKFIEELRRLLTGSRVIVPLVTQRVVDEQQRASRVSSWVKREIDYRLAVFPDGTNVLPIGVSGANTSVVAGGITPIGVPSGVEARAVERVSAAIQDMIEANPLPLAREPLSWKTKLRVLEGD